MRQVKEMKNAHRKGIPGAMRRWQKCKEANKPKNDFRLELTDMKGEAAAEVQSAGSFKGLTGCRDKEDLKDIDNVLSNQCV